LALNVLRDDLVWRGWAEERLQQLASDPHLAGDGETQRIRSLMPLEDDLPLTNTFRSEGFTVNPRAMLLSLLKRNGGNRMAFEYLMAMYLDNNDVDGAVGLFPYMDGLSYAQIPPCYEHAFLIQSIHTSRRPEQAAADADLICRGRKISPTAMASFRRLGEIAGRHGGLNEKAQADVARDLGDTYFYYFYYASQGRP
jgi:hypothetical protein